MDLAKYDDTAVEQGAVMELLDPLTDEPTGATITLLGYDSAKAKEIIHKNSNKRMKKRSSISAENIEANGLDLVVALTVSWKDIDEKGKPLKCTPENVKKVYEDYGWIRDQVDTYIGDRANFLTKS